jgi:hypothetical protein
MDWKCSSRHFSRVHPATLAPQALLLLLLLLLLPLPLVLLVVVLATSTSFLVGARAVDCAMS